MQLLEVPFTQDGSGYFIKATDGMCRHTMTLTLLYIMFLRLGIYVCGSGIRLAYAGNGMVAP